MTNKIKFINMQTVFEILCEAEKTTLTNERELEIEKTVSNIEKRKGFSKLFFFGDKERYEYFYLEDREQEIKNYLAKYIDIKVLENSKYEVFKDYIQDLCECGLEDVTFETHLGELTINGEDILTALEEEFLNEEENICRVVSAEDFYGEMKKIKKECLQYLIDTHLTEVKNQLKFFEFEY